MSENKHALTVVGSAELSAPSALLTKLQAAALHQVSLIRRTESEASQRAILLGLTLWRIKASMKGKFTGWLKEDFDALGYRQARYYMSAGLVFIEKTKATLPEFLALPGEQSELALDAMPDAKSRALMAKIEKFVGGRALGEMFEDLGIKEGKKGKKRSGGGNQADDEEEQEAETVRTTQDLFNEIEANLSLARKAAADPAVWMRFSKQQHDDLKTSFEAAAAKVAENHAKTHSRKR